MTQDSSPEVGRDIGKVPYLLGRVPQTYARDIDPGGRERQGALMRRPRPLPAALLGITAALALTACGSDAPENADPATTSSSAPASSPPDGASSGTPSGTTSPSGTPTTDATDSPAGCGVVPGRLPDGTWAGPIAMDVDGRGGDAGFASSKGRGTMRLVVADGTVTSGTWTVAWRSRGTADTGQAAATLTLRGRIAGSVKGPAGKPVLDGTWSLNGQVHITKPVDQRAPVSETGTGTETLEVTDVSCETVTGTFLPSFNSKDAAATFTGTATWVGKPVG